MRWERHRVVSPAKVCSVATKAESCQLAEVDWRPGLPLSLPNNVVQAYRPIRSRGDFPGGGRRVNHEKAVAGRETVPSKAQHRPSKREPRKSLHICSRDRCFQWAGRRSALGIVRELLCTRFLATQCVVQSWARMDKRPEPALRACMPTVFKRWQAAKSGHVGPRPRPAD